jgi:hypothetical protein
MRAENRVGIAAANAWTCGDGRGRALRGVIGVVALDPARILAQDLVLGHGRREDRSEQAVRLHRLRLGPAVIDQFVIPADTRQRMTSHH